MDEYRGYVRLAVLVFLLIALAAPWGYSMDGVPPSEWCSAPNILVESSRFGGERCVRPVRGLEVIAFTISSMTEMPIWLTSGSAVLVDMAREMMITLLLCLLPLPFFTTLGVLWRGETRRRRMVNGVVWGLAAIPALFIVLNGSAGLFRLSWGGWLFTGLAAGVVVLDLLFPGLTKATGRRLLLVAFGGLILTSCIPKGAKNWLFSIGPQTYEVALGDLDGDGDLDAFMANGENEVPVPNNVWFNNGTGHFRDSGQQIGRGESHHVVLADMDGDGDLDAVVSDTGPIAIYLNDGQGVFRGANQYLVQEDMGSYLLALAVGDVNEDGFLDVLGGGCCGATSFYDDGRTETHLPHDSLWINPGVAQSGEPGVFKDSRERFDTFGTNTVGLGDLDGDGDLDAFFGNSSSEFGQPGQTDHNQPDTIWFNDGGLQGGEAGTFKLSDQMLGHSEATTLALGDLDGDGDLDGLVGTRLQDEIWLNEGGRQGGTPGSFIGGDRLETDRATRSFLLGDLDSDGDLDGLWVGEQQAVVWWNDGQAGFEAGPGFKIEPQHALALGDLNGDGSPDIFAGSVNHGQFAWFNNGMEGFAKERAD